MPELSVFAKFAQYLSPPLIIAGLALMLVFGVHKQLIASGILPPVDKKSGAGILRLLLNHALTFGLTAMLLGFGLMFFDTWLEKQPPAEETPPPAAGASPTTSISGNNGPVVTGDGNTVLSGNTVVFPGQERLDALGGRAEGGGYRLILGGLHFDSGRAVLLPPAEPLLEAVTAALNADPGLRALIEGHADDQGGRDANQTLSEHRADAVRAALLGRGISAGQLERKGYGNTRPLADNTTEAGRQLNRRVEILLHR
jgi:outer membrane protein OmpA-like peptidoglycan-associated protein